MVASTSWLQLGRRAELVYLRRIGRALLFEGLELLRISLQAFSYFSLSVPHEYTCLRLWNERSGSSCWGTAFEVQYSCGCKLSPSTTFAMQPGGNTAFALGKAIGVQPFECSLLAGTSFVGVWSLRRSLVVAGFLRVRLLEVRVSSYECSLWCTIFLVVSFCG